MKIYILLMLISIIVGVSYLPLRRPARAPTLVSSAPTASESVAAGI